MLTKNQCLDLVNQFNKRRVEEKRKEIEKLEAEIPEVIKKCLSLVNRGASKGYTSAILYSDYWEDIAASYPLDCYHEYTEDSERKALSYVEKQVFKKLRDLGFKIYPESSPLQEYRVIISWKPTLWERFLKLIRRSLP